MSERFHASGEAVLIAAEVVDRLCFNGGLHLYDQYLHKKDNAHCAQRLVQFFEEGVQVGSSLLHLAVLVLPGRPRRGRLRRGVEPRRRARKIRLNFAGERRGGPLGDAERADQAGSQGGESVGRCFLNVALETGAVGGLLAEDLQGAQAAAEEGLGHAVQAGRLDAREDRPQRFPLRPDRQ